MKIQVTHQYDDIINLPYHQSKTRPHMSLSDRAAQFSPFAALTGYDDEVKEAARVTDKKIDLSEEMRRELDEKLQILREHMGEYPQVSFTYFLQDTKKTGGSYVTVTGNVKRIDEYGQRIVLLDGSQIPIKDILKMTGEVTVHSRNAHKLRIYDPIQ